MGVLAPSAGQRLADWVREKATSSGVGGSPVTSQQSSVSLRGIAHNLVFSSSDANTVAWTSGIIMLSDGRSFSIDAGNTGNMSALTYIYLDVDESETVLQTSTTYSNAVGNRKYLIAVAEDATTAASYIVVSGSGGFGGELIVNANMISNLLITASQIANATITSGKTVVALRNISHNLVFSSTDENTVAWASGTITLSDGTAYSITGGNTGNMAARTYIYLDPSTSTTVLQVTTTAATASADGKYLIASAINVADTDKLATFTVFSGAGGVGGLLITSADQIAALSIVAGVIDNLTITAAKIANLTINAGKFDIDDVAWSNLLTGGGYESWSAGASAAPDAWTLTGAGATIARNGTNVKGMGLYSVDVTAALNTATDLAQSLTVSSTVNATLRGRAVTFTCYVKAGAASRAFLKIDDGVGTTSSSNHSGGGTFELLSVTRTLDASATKCECSVEISSGASITVTADDAMLVPAETPLAFSLNFLDKALAISNYQDQTPTNYGDQGVWRMEIGVATIAGDTGSSATFETVTFATAFRTIRVGFACLFGGATVGGDRSIVYVNTLTASTFDLSVATCDAGVFASTATGDVIWLIIGQV